MNRNRYLSIILLVLLPATAAYANAGTPLMWATSLHLSVGNLLIGLGEWAVLARWFRSWDWKAALALILGNYMSAWLGMSLIIGNLAQRIDITIENYTYWFRAFAVLAFVITLIVEFPFFFFALRRLERRFRKAIIATLVLHTVSYAALFGWYSLASYDSMVTELEQVPVSEMALPEGHELYYIADDRTSIMRSDLDGRNAERIAEVEPVNDHARLFARPRKDDGFDLLIYRPSDEHRDYRYELILDDFSAHAPVEWMIEQGRAHGPEPHYGTAVVIPKLTPEGTWEYRTGFWAAQGISGRSDETNSEFSFSLETPLAQWIVKSATHINGDYVVFQMGRDQICIMQPEDRQIALILRGQGPLVAKDEP